MNNPEDTSIRAGMRRLSHRTLWRWVVVGLLLGAIFGLLAPEDADNMKLLADTFVRLITMVIAPIIFCTVVVGIASLGNLRKVGRVGAKALAYFLAVSTFALVVGLIVANVVRPGEGIDAGETALSRSSIENFESKAEQVLSPVDFVLTIVPKTVVAPFSEGNILQVLFLAVLFAVALSLFEERAQPVLNVIDRVGEVFFAAFSIIIYAAPVAAFGGIAYTVAEFGVSAIGNLLELMAAFALTCIAFVFGFLALIARLHGFSLLRLVRYIQQEILIVLGTSSSDSVLPRLLRKLELAGASRAVVGVTLPSGYSFNLNGTSLYLTMGAVFVAQVSGLQLSAGEQLFVLGVLIVASRGATGITGSGFITLAAALAAIHAIPLTGLALLLAIDRFMSYCRALTNLVGYCVATLVVARWERELDLGRLDRVLRGEVEVDVDSPDRREAEEILIIDTYVTEGDGLRTAAN